MAEESSLFLQQKCSSVEDKLEILKYSRIRTFSLIQTLEFFCGVPSCPDNQESTVYVCWLFWRKNLAQWEVFTPSFNDDRRPSKLKKKIPLCTRNAYTTLKEVTGSGKYQLHIMVVTMARTIYLTNST